MIDIKKKYKTRDGRDVRLLCTDGPDEYPVIGIVEGCIDPHSWSNTGRFDLLRAETPKDLIEVPNTVTKTYYRRKWNMGEDGVTLCTNFGYSISKDLFDAQFEVDAVPHLWSDEWEEITIEVPV